MNQRRLLNTVNSSSIDGRQRNSSYNTNLILSTAKNSSKNSEQQASISNNISCFLPSERPNIETTHTYHQGAVLNYPKPFYSVEEHHDDYTFQTSQEIKPFQHLNIIIPKNHFNNQANIPETNKEVNLLLAAHSYPSNTYESAGQPASNSFNSNQNGAILSNKVKVTDQSVQEVVDHSFYRKPLIYHADDRKVERVTYYPVGERHTYATYPIVELSVPKLLEENYLIDATHINQNKTWSNNHQNQWSKSVSKNICKPAKLDFNCSSAHSITHQSNQSNTVFVTIIALLGTF
ncbi:unnamed protein product [Thelazia callipaeda]|uniref:Zasp-like motif domain-containing protein n=1 Tax=Thelazia callipaeda TaxID=103827 RepID=A0A158RCN7_THECL|nr:unnamed protein product [Thelazia callipaeda]